MLGQVEYDKPERSEARDREGKEILIFKKCQARLSTIDPNVVWHMIEKGEKLLIIKISQARLSTINPNIVRRVIGKGNFNF